MTGLQLFVRLTRLCGRFLQSIEEVPSVLFEPDSPNTIRDRERGIQPDLDPDIPGSYQCNASN